MKFNTRNEFIRFLRQPYVRRIGLGSQGECFLDLRTSKIYKVFNDFFDCGFGYENNIKYDKNELLRFKDVENSTYIWQDDIIEVNDEIVGIICNYVKGKNMYRINPFDVNLDEINKAVDQVYKDAEIISNNGIISYDVPYNTMYGKQGYKIVDTAEYYTKDEDSKKLLSQNKDNFNIGLMQFLIDGYFEEFIQSNKILKEMYLSKDVDVREFITIFQNQLSEVVGDRVTSLNNSKQCVNKKRILNYDYIREIR